MVASAVISGLNAFATLVGSVNSTDTVINVSSASTYAAGDVVKIDNEQILISSIGPGQFLGCIRGYNSTTPASHAGSSQVYYWAPGPSNTQIYVNSTSQFPWPIMFSYVIKIDDEQMKVVGGGSIAFTVIRGFNGTTPSSHENGASVALVDWIWLNQICGATIESNSNGEYLTSQSAFGGVHKLIGRISGISLPASPFNIVTKLGVLFPKNQFFGAGIFFRESSTGKILSLHFQNNGLISSSEGFVTMYVFKYNNENSWRTDIPMAIDCNLWPVNSSYFRMGVNGSNMTFGAGVDGLHFQDVYSEAKNTFFTNGPDQAGFYIDPHSQVGGCNLSQWTMTN